jgi:thiamine-phosphate pyrophosphorylase
LFISGRPLAARFPDKRPLFYYVTDGSQLTGISLLSCIRRAIIWGVDFIQVREKDLTDRELLDLTRRTVAMTRGTHCRVLVNGRSDVARAAGAHGVHLPSTGLAPGDLHRDLTRGMIVGNSTHSLAEARRAAERGAHYILLGPLYPTASKISLGSPMELARFRRICAAVRIPVLGLGGIHAESIEPILAAGAAGVAGISLFQRELDRINFFRRQGMS